MRSDHVGNARWAPTASCYTGSRAGAARQRRGADLVAHLAEVDARQLYLEEGCSSIVFVLPARTPFAEGVAYKRIQAARAARRHPQLLEALRSGELHLTAVGLLRPSSRRATARSDQRGSASWNRGNQANAADREPKPDVPTSVRRVAEQIRAVAPASPAPASNAQQVFRPAAIAPPAAKARTEPLGAERYRVQFTADRETHAQLEELRTLMRHQVPDGDVGRSSPKRSRAAKQVRKQKFADTYKPVRPG